MSYNTVFTLRDSPSPLVARRRRREADSGDNPESLSKKTNLKHYYLDIFEGKSSINLVVENSKKVMILLLEIN
jgi:hypothetical protein